MFEKSLIRQVMKYAHKRNKSLNVVQRYLSIHYKINISMRALEKRKFWMKTLCQIC